MKNEEEEEEAYSNFKFVSNPISLGTGPDKALIPKVLVDKLTDGA